MEIVFRNHVGEIEYHGISKVDRVTYMGIFEYKTLLSPRDLIQIDSDFRELVGLANVQLADVRATAHALALANIKTRIVKAPDWFYSSEDKRWPGSHLEENILHDLYDKSLQVEVKYAEKKQKEFDDMEQDLARRFKSGQIKQPDPEPMS